MLYIQVDGRFVRTDPILTDRDAPDKYLIEVQMQQNGNTKPLQRYRIATAAIVEDDDLGEVLSVFCESIAIEALMESEISINDVLVSPNRRVRNILTAHNGSGSDATLLTFDTPDIDIPDSDSLQFDYRPTSPKPVSDLLREVISRLQEAGPLGGVFRNYYYTTEAEPLTTNAVKFKVEEFGKDDSGVTVSPDNSVPASLSSKKLMTSNKKRKKISIVKFGQKSGSLPRNHMEFSSRFLHATNRREWDVARDYGKGDPVKWTDTTQTPNIVRFFVASSDVPGGGNSPNVDNFNWHEDFTIIPEFSEDAFYDAGEVVTFESGGAVNFFAADSPNGPSATPPNLGGDWTQIMLARPASTYGGFVSPSPWTADLQNFLQNLAAVTAPPSGYLGFALDWNYARILNDIRDHTNRFLIITGKEVTRESSAPPTGRELFNGQKILVGPAATGLFAGQEQRIAEYSVETFRGIAAHWEFSDPPVDGETIFDHSTGRLRRYAGTHPGGSWDTAWDVTNNDKPSPAHLVKSARLVADASQIPGQAVEYRFDWKEALLGGDDRNRTSRGAWINFRYPYPVLDSPTTNIGGEYGGDGTIAPSNPYIDHINLNFNSKGLIGWNRGRDSEDLGRLSEHAFKIRLGLFRSSDDSVLSKGKANIAMIYWRKDANNRIFFKDFQIPENGQWHSVRIALPPFGPENLYFNRIDELAEVLGYTIPFDFFIQEKEFAGVKYEFTRNDAWGVFMKETYNDTGMYVGNYANFINHYIESGTQIFGDALEFIDAIATGGNPFETAFATETSTVDHANIAVCQLHYNKEGYAIFPRTANEIPRYDVIPLLSETDYLTALAKAESSHVRNDFFPNERHVSCHGDVRIEYGQMITETGDRVPGGTLQGVVALQKETFDNRGYNAELFVVRKFVI